MRDMMLTLASGLNGGAIGAALIVAGLIVLVVALRKPAPDYYMMCGAMEPKNWQI